MKGRRVENVFEPRHRSLYQYSERFFNGRTGSLLERSGPYSLFPCTSLNILLNLL
jgi:hypothetical protein